MNMNRWIGSLLALGMGCDAPTVKDTVYGEFEPLEMCDFMQLDDEGLPFVTMDDFLIVRGHAVAATVSEHIARFDNLCLGTERLDDPPWAGTLYSGCGYVQYEPVYDESFYALYSYSAETGKLVGAIMSSDAPQFCPGLDHIECCLDRDLRYGDIGISLPGRVDPECDSVLKTYCWGESASGSR